jgi:D-3-phosphoglycerate dehydrogenase
MASDQLKPLHIAFLTPMAQVTLEAVRNLLPAGCTIAFAQTSTKAEQVKLLADADVVMIAGTFIEGDVIRQAPRLKMIQKWGIGVDKIDLVAAKECNVLVSITSGATSIPVSEHTLLLMLAVTRRLPLAHRSLGQGQWIAADLRTVCSKLDGKTVGLFGFGGIAQQVAKRLTGFDVEVIYHTRNRVAPEIENKLQARYVDFDTLVANSDILSLHAPLSPQTHHRFNADTLASMKRGAILINTARGELIDEPALIRALQQGKLSGAGLDTFEAEPPSADNPLFHMDQVVATPHSAGGVYDNLPNLVGHMFRNIELFRRGMPIPEADLVASRVD